MRIPREISISYVAQAPVEIKKKKKKKESENPNAMTPLKTYFLISQQEQLGNVSSNFNLCA